MGWVDDPVNAWKFRDIVTSQVSILELAKEYKIQLAEKYTGQFTHIARCPFHSEKTPSFYISHITNTFHCFGCSKGGTVIEFVSFADGTPAIIALEKLGKKIGLIDKNGKWDELRLEIDGNEISPFDPMKTIEPYLFEISSALRKHITKFVNTPDFTKELRWMERVAAKVDKFLVDISYDDWEYVKSISTSVQNSIKKRNK
jgi:hypothetical protein